MIGAVPDLEFQSGSCQLDAFAKLYLYSDGAYEIERIDKTMWPFDEFVEFMKQGPHDAEDGAKMDRLIAPRPRDPGPRRVRRRLLDRRVPVRGVSRWPAASFP